jgi:hypothetical protein
LSTLVDDLGAEEDHHIFSIFRAETLLKYLPLYSVALKDKLTLTQSQTQRSFSISVFSLKTSTISEFLYSLSVFSCTIKDCFKRAFCQTVSLLPM